MLPLGVLDLGRRSTRFTPDEQRTLMTLWSIARSPLIHGGDMTRTDAATLDLLTNDEVIAVDQHSDGNRPLFDRDGLVAWTASVPGSPDRYLALFNTRDRFPLGASPPAVPADPVGAPFRVPLAELGLSGRCRVRDLWTHETLPSVERELVAVVPWHGAKLCRLSPGQ
jgi:hypothetical protein